MTFDDQRSTRSPFETDASSDDIALSGSDGPTKIAFQQTLKSPINCSGIGLHTGAKVNMVLLPAPENTGILFRRTDLYVSDQDIPANWNSVTATMLGTTVGNSSGAAVMTIEHLMSALAGCGIDNAIVEINGPEVPAMDGSAAPFVFLIECAGVVEQDAVRQVIRVLKTIRVEHENKSAELRPAEGFRVSFEIDFDSNVVARQEQEIDIEGHAFKTEVSRARTFGFLHEVEALHAAGFGKGGSLDNAVVVDRDRVLNPDGLRYDDEFVRHKILDSVGDLYLAGHPIQGHYHGVRAGHMMTARLLKALFADETAWTLEPVVADHAIANQMAATA